MGDVHVPLPRLPQDGRGMGRRIRPQQAAVRREDPLPQRMQRLLQPVVSDYGNRGSVHLTGGQKLPAEDQEKLKDRARKYLPQRDQLLAERNVPDAWGRLPPPGLRLPCPALEDGACQIYSHRPLICRKYGIPLYNPKKPDQLFACELNFKPGEEIDATELVQIQTGIQDRWAGVQADYNRRGGRRDPQPLTIARAILEEFEPYLPR